MKLTEQEIQQLIKKRRRIMHPDLDHYDGYQTDQELKKPQPPLVKAAMRETSIALPLDFEKLDIDNDFLHVINSRRSHRIYTEEQMTLRELSFLLWCSQGVKEVRGKSYATLRTVPGGGARHPFEVYMAIQNVEGLKNGFYHYLPMKHHIECLLEQQDLKDFIARFSANKSKSNQATSRRKLIEKLTVEELPASSRRYPFIGFDMDRELGKDILQVDGLTKTVDGVKLLDNVSFTLGRNDKVAFVGESEQAITMLFKILMEEEQPDSGSFKWGVSVTTSYMPVDNSEYFNGCELSILDWIRQYSVKDETETYLRGFLGRMLFSGDDVYKPVNVLSGGEKVRCMFSRMMLFGSNVLVLDRPTNHLDLESITAVNNSLINFKGVVLLASHDHEIMQTTANRIIEILPQGCLDRQGTYEEFIDFMK